MLRTPRFDSRKVTLDIMGGLPGLKRVFKEEITNAKVQRCQFHVARNVWLRFTRKKILKEYSAVENAKKEALIHKALLELKKYEGRV